MSSSLCVLFRLLHHVDARGAQQLLVRRVRDVVDVLAQVLVLLLLLRLLLALLDRLLLAALLGRWLLIWS